jgi:two-component system CheB/CheR fusion protein
MSRRVRPVATSGLAERVAMVAHELSSPATTLMAFAELLADDGYSAADRRAMCALMVAEGQRLTTMIHDLQAINQVRRPPFEVVPRPIDVHQILEHAAMAARVDTRHQLTVDVPDVLPLVQADAVRVQQVLANLISNAQKYTPAGGQVHVSARRFEDSVEFSVVDDGLGIPDGARSRLFEKFFRVEGQDRRFITGKGLGLAICKDIVEAHAGRIGFESSGPGAGSRFWFTLPTAHPAVAPFRMSAARSVPRPPVATRSAVHVLVVDDVPAIGRMVTHILDTADYAVVTVTTGAEALERLHAEHFDVVLSDLGIGPGIDGMELFARVRRTWPTTRFILATGSVTLDADAARRLGIDEVLTKPYRPADLRRVIARLTSTPPLRAKGSVSCATRF